MATVRLPNGKVYVGEAVYDGRAIAMPAAQLRHRDLQGPRLYPPRALTWSIAAITTVEWYDGDGARP